MNSERYKALSECVVLMEAQLRVFSKNEALLTAKEGYERPFDETRQTLYTLKEMLREVRYAQAQSKGTGA